MSPSQLPQIDIFENCIQNAIFAYNSRQYTSIWGAADAFNVSFTTLRDCLTGVTSRAQAHAMQQILSNAEEMTLVWWITCLTITGYPASPKLVLEMAEEICCERVFLASQATSASLGLCPIGHNWLTCFKQRDPKIFSIWTRQIANSCFKAAT